jgi:hypothetical protein
MFLGGILAGTIGAGGVGAFQYSRLQEKVYTDSERLARIEADVKWIREMLAQKGFPRYNGNGKP